MPYVPVPEYTEFKALRNSKPFKKLMEEAIDLKSQIKALQERESELKEELEAELIAAEVEGSVSYNGWRVQIIDKVGSPKLDKKKLLALLGSKGVEILKKASVPGAPSHYVQIVSPKEETETAE